MNNLDELTLKVEKIIETEKAVNPDIKYLNSSHSGLIAQIISNYKLKPTEEEKPSAEMIFLGAPTGAGKDTLVKKIKSDNPDKKFVILNMDMFRYYHEEISDSSDTITDKDFAVKTNQTSYELYYIIQEIILREFPGINVIVTGTMRDLDWIKEIFERYKKDEKTNYTTSLVTLAVPTNESAFSTIERYLNMVDVRGNLNASLRYTSLEYHNDTVKKFRENLRIFEEDFKLHPDNRLFDSIRVYRRAKDIMDLSEDTLVYDSNNNPEHKSAFEHIYNIMGTNANISNIRIYDILKIIERDAEYLKEQGLYTGILEDLKSMLPQLNKKTGCHDDPENC